MEDVIVPIFLFGGTAVVLWKFFDTRHKERMSIIDKALDPIAYKELYGKRLAFFSPLSNLKWGLVAMFIGIGVLIAMWLSSVYQFMDGIYPSMILLCGGFALILFYFISRKKMSSDNG